MKPLLVVLDAPHLLSLPACLLDLAQQSCLLDLQELDARPQLHLLSLHRRTRRLQLKQGGLLRHGRERVRRHHKGGVGVEGGPHIMVPTAREVVGAMGGFRAQGGVGGAQLFLYLRCSLRVQS
jgi:hypothetical protein